ncbi:hypothetical protein AKJ09_09849 [Labilithrix luteola]|uniref:Phage protein n=1 Tax=Labilithrix luteola TaxID=1391654 RepID=A0A0K1QBM6_9BACT|nr:hypothetical protein [Labilithrix luteola]AKV03186.1 hypothetical protein AKJ09_09849 [Labilithrix luteola]
MAAITTQRDGSIRIVDFDKRPLAAGVVARKGGRVAVNATGFYCPATGAATELVLHAIFVETVDNSGGAAGAKSANVRFFRERTLLLQNNDAGTAVTTAARERVCYQLDDQTVTGDNAKAPAGVVYDVTAEGVWVDEGVSGTGVTDVD